MQIRNLHDFEPTVGRNRQCRIKLRVVFVRSAPFVVRKRRPLRRNTERKKDEKNQRRKNGGYDNQSVKTIESVIFKTINHMREKAKSP